MRDSRHDAGTVYRRLAVVFLVVFLLSAAFFAISLWEKTRGGFSGENPDQGYLEYQGRKYAERKDLEAFLVLGLDQYADMDADESYNNNKRADFILLFVFDHTQKTYTTLHINRDTMVQMNVLGVAGNKVGTATKQLALAHTYGNGRDVSCRNTADAVSKLLLGVQIDHYMSVTMDAVAQLTDLVGGVEVTVLDDFSGVDDTLVKGETVLLTGEKALTYVRSRSGLEDSSNSTRMSRQQQFLQALQQRLVEKMAADGEFMLQAAMELSEYVVTDRSVTQLQQLADNLYQYEIQELPALQGELKSGEMFMEFYPDQAQLQELVVGLFFEPTT